jgi:hypothetical protein
MEEYKVFNFNGKYCSGDEIVRCCEDEEFVTEDYSEPNMKLVDAQDDLDDALAHVSVSAQIESECQRDMLEAESKGWAI